MEKESFILYSSQYKHIQRLSQTQKGELLDAIYQYSLGEQIHFNDDKVELIFGFIQDGIDRASEKWETVRQRRIAAGRLGAIAKHNKDVAKVGNAKQCLAKVGNAKQCLAKVGNAKQCLAKDGNAWHNVNVNDNVNVNGNVNVIEKESTNVLKKEKRTNVVFQRPTLEEIKSYIQEKNYTHVDAERFYDFYESKNWMVGKNKMTKWKNAVANWERMGKERQQPNPKVGVVIQPDKIDYENMKSGW